MIVLLMAYLDEICSYVNRKPEPFSYLKLCPL